jgi:hypothetical protein
VGIWVLRLVRASDKTVGLWPGGGGHLLRPYITFVRGGARQAVYYVSACALDRAFVHRDSRLRHHVSSASRAGESKCDRGLWCGRDQSGKLRRQGQGESSSFRQENPGRLTVSLHPPAASVAPFQLPGRLKRHRAGNCRVNRPGVLSLALKS